MKIYNYVFFCFVLIFSCKSDDIHSNINSNPPLNNSDYRKELKEMYFEDQSLRRVMSVMDRKCDDSSEFSNFDIHRLIFNSTLNKQDSLRTLRFLELIKDYGYPDKSINTENIAFYTILLHSPKSLHNKIEEVLNKSSIPPKEYEAVKWHLNGRKGMPIFINGMKYFNDDEVFNFYKTK